MSRSTREILPLLQLNEAATSYNKLNKNSQGQYLSFTFLYKVKALKDNRGKENERTAK